MLGSDDVDGPARAGLPVPRDAQLKLTDPAALPVSSVNAFPTANPVLTDTIDIGEGLTTTANVTRRRWPAPSVCEGEITAQPNKFAPAVPL
jgi:hypothetical protein